MGKTFDIYFYDLKPEVQKQIAEYFNFDPSETNWDCFPLFVLEEEWVVPQEDED